MKKLIFLFLISISLFVLISGCSDNKILSESKDSAIMLFTDFFKPNHDELAMHPSESMWVASVTHDNKQLTVTTNKGSTKNDFVQWENNTVRIANKIMNANNDSLNYIKAKDYYTSDSTGYETLTEDDILMITTNNFDPILTKVRYIDYTQSSSVPDPKWANGILKTISDNCMASISVPAIITESWSFEYKGQKIDIVNATNYVVKKEEIKILTTEEFYDKFKKLLPPQAGMHIRYIIGCIFVDGELYKNNIDTYLISMISATNDLDFYNSNMRTTCIGGYYYYDFDENANIKLYPIAASEDSEPKLLQQRKSYLFADVDQDGNGEIVFYSDFNENSVDRYLTAHTLNSNPFVEDLLIPLLKN